MVDLPLAALSALWLGILTSISPCPLATNIAAISFVGRSVGSPRRVLVSGVLYTAGRTIAYVGLAFVLIASLMSAPQVSHVLQKYMNKALGPILVIVGLLLLGWIETGWTGSSPGEGLQRRAGKWGMWGAGFLGFIFALSFCPISAALYFGSLLPLALENESKVLLPLLYGVGTALPVVVFAGVIAWSAKSLSKAFAGVTRVERWARLVTGGVFVVVGVYLTLENIFGIF
jgi:cytochrome c biogenesis protein CcdA